MNKYLNFAQIERALEPYAAAASKTSGSEMTTDRTLRLAKIVGNPHEKLKIVHVAGTSGKTSTCYYIADLLRRAGKKVGLTVSPHMDSIAERVQIDGQPLSEDRFCDYFGEFMVFVESAPEMPTYFELMMVFAFWVFRKEKVDYAVVETGLGGLHDSSNITSRTDKLCLLTDIGYDHMHVLGRSIGEITHQKVGIVKPGNILVMHEQSAEVMTIVREYLKQQKGILATQDDDSRVFQERNWNLAFGAYEQLRIRDNLAQLGDTELKYSHELHVPGRMDIFTISGKTIVLDGAHNEQKMNAFIVSLKTQFPGKKFPVLVALKQGKDLEQLAGLLADNATNAIATEFDSKQDTQFSAVSAGEIAHEFEKLGVEAFIEPSVDKAVIKLLSLPDDIVVVSGSLYLVAEVRKLLHVSGQ